MIKLAACTKGSKALSVLKQSVETYAPNVELCIYQTDHTNFGDAYNYAMSLEFKNCDEMLIANDDIVLNPHTISLLLSDVAELKKRVPLLGLVAPKSDNVRGIQSVKYNFKTEIQETFTLSPILAWISKEAFEKVQFPPINWYSDDVMCADLSALGYRHFFSRSYVHHVGSSTIGHDAAKHVADAMPWLLRNRIEYVKQWWPAYKG